MRVWRIKLKGHDLFYQPTNSCYGGGRTNLGKNGKIYARKPLIPRGTAFISTALCAGYPEILTEKVGYYRNQRIVAKPEWELKVYELKEVEDVV